jgi:hypothetical protein
MLVFAQTMRRVRVRPIHALRCTLYCSDLSVWWAFVTLLLLAVLALIPTSAGFEPTSLTGWSVPMIWLAFTIRLSVAYRRYMQFDKSLLTVIASQLIAFFLWLNIVVVISK